VNSRRFRHLQRDEWLFLGKLALAGCVFPLVWALLVPIAIELFRESPSDCPVNPRLARSTVRV